MEEEEEEKRRERRGVVEMRLSRMDIDSHGHNGQSRLHGTCMFVGAQTHSVEQADSIGFITRFGRGD